MITRFVHSLCLAGGLLLLSAPCFAQVEISTTMEPPELPTYQQTECPGDGYIWTPGYWGWDGSYYWVPGTWVIPPEAGDLWTPGYWGWGGSSFIFNEGYWGSSVGFYGGVDYGFGYFGHGYDGGRWDHGHFFYNTRTNRVGGDFHNVYDTQVDERVNRVSYNGGHGGIDLRATHEEEEANHSAHTGQVSGQRQHEWAAHNDPQQRYSANHGAPKLAATVRANVATHPRDLPPVGRASFDKSGNDSMDRRNQQQQDKMVSHQNQDRQRLQRQQDKEDQQVTRQHAGQERMQQTEQRHQEQTQHMEEGHAQQMQRMRPQAPRGGGGGRRK